MKKPTSIQTLIYLWLALSGAPHALAEEAKNEFPEWVQLPLSVSKETLSQVFAAPVIETADGFSATVLVPPQAQLFGPFDLHVIDNHTVWVADDAKSGAIFKVTLDGQVTILADIKKHSQISLDLAPPSFGPHQGQIYTVAFAKPEKAGGWELPDAITRIDPTTGLDTVVCFLPENEAHEPGAGGFFARFGPEHGPFAGKLWITAASNHTLYQVTPTGACTPFVTIDLEKWGSPRGIGFSQDGQTMLLGSAAPTPANRAKTTPGGGRILRVSADGSIAAAPLVGGLHEPGAMAFAPASFGKFAGELFISDSRWSGLSRNSERRTRVSRRRICESSGGGLSWRYFDGLRHQRRFSHRVAEIRRRFHRDDQGALAREPSEFSTASSRSTISRANTPDSSASTVCPPRATMS